MTKIVDPEIDLLIGSAEGASADGAPLTGNVLPARSGGAPLAPLGGGAYTGASRMDRDLALWAPPIRSADMDLLPDKESADARIRDLMRNDATVSSGSTLHKDNIVGSQFMLNAKPSWKVLGLDEKWAEEFQQEVEEKFTLWAESADNWIDASRMNSLTAMIRLVVGIDLAAGEVLASVEWLRDGPRAYNTAIQMIDLDRLSNPNGEADGPLLRAGVERNRYGAPTGYYVRMAHPSDFMNPDAWVWKYVPIRKPWGRIQMIHLVEQQRPDQSRGVSDIVAALKELRIMKRFRDVTLQNAVLNATFAASIESELPSEAVFASLGGKDDVSEAITGYASSFLTAISGYAGGSRNMQIDGVKIPHLFPGTKLQLRPVGSGGPLGSEFEQSCLRYVAANLGVSYEELSRDYTNTNYSSARAAMLNTWRRMQSKKKQTADRFAGHIYALWLEEAMNKGQITAMSKRAPSFYEGLNKAAYTGCEWIGAARGQIDELKETQAAALRLKNNLSTYEDEMARLGKDWRKTLVQREREVKEFKARGLDPNPQDNSLNAASGSPRDQQSGPKQGN